MPSLPEMTTERTYITVLSPKIFTLFQRYRITNESHLQPWEPIIPYDFHADGACLQYIEQLFSHYNQNSAYPFVALTKDKKEVIGTCSFSQVSHGAFQACYMGYAIAATHQGHELMYEIVDAAHRYMFENVGLHRIMANYMPCNSRSGRLLKKLGFEEEGKAKSYLKINGQWEDHILTSKINPAH